jgi:hypothetical protein
VITSLLSPQNDDRVPSPTPDDGRLADATEQITADDGSHRGGPAESILIRRFPVEYAADDSSADNDDDVPHVRHQLDSPAGDQNRLVSASARPQQCEGRWDEWQTPFWAGWAVTGP